MISEILENTDIHGFSFINDFTELDVDVFNYKLKLKNINLHNVIVSLWEDIDCIWLVAASRYLNDDEIKEIIDFLISNDIEDEYCLN